jgi:hypothetical protein
MTGFVAALGAALLLVLLPVTPAAAAGPDVAITELHFHPESDDEDEEVVELHNPGPGAADLTGWCFTSGISHCFDPGTTIPAGAFFLGTPDAATFTATYGGAPDFEYGGNLANSGETVRLVDGSAATVEQVTYGERTPWPTTPDGRGPSLERRDPAEDPDTPRSWAASTAPAGHTVGAASSVAGTGLLPGIDAVTPPEGHEPQEAVTITAAVEGAEDVSLVHVVGFGAETSTPMLDDGAHGDGGAGDGTYGATIPGQAAGSLVRYRVEATTPGAANAEPRADDTRGYLGHTVADASVQTALPVVEWFIEEDDYQHLVANPHTDTLRPSVIAHDGIAHDGAQVRVQGSPLGRFREKAKWKVELAPGHLLDVGDLATGPLDELSLDSAELDAAKASIATAWATVATDARPTPGAATVRVQRNGSFQGAYVLLEGYDDEWRSRHDLEDALLYEAEAAWFDGTPLHEQFVRRNGGAADDATLQALLDVVLLPPGPERDAALAEQLDVPSVVDALALATAMANPDVQQRNFYLVGDAGGRGRWGLLPTDLDQALAQQGYVPRTVHPLLALGLGRPLLNDPDVLAMYLRRLRTLVDEQLATGAIADRLVAAAATARPDALLDAAAWPTDDLAPDEVLAADLATLEQAEQQLLADGGATPLLPPAAGEEELTVRIAELHYNPPQGSDAEHLELANPSGQAVDLSGWQLTGGVEATLPPGSVIPAGGRALVVNDDPTFRAVHGPDQLVLAEYEGNLSNSGEAVVLDDPTRPDPVDEVAYDDAAPWPTAPDGGGPSLERIDLEADGGAAAAWAAAPIPGGTPGLPPGGSRPTLHVSATVAPEIVLGAGSGTVTVRLHNTGALATGPLQVTSPDAPACEQPVAPVPASTTRTVTCTVSASAPGTLATRLAVTGGPEGPVGTTALMLALPAPATSLGVEVQPSSGVVEAGQPIELQVRVTNPDVNVVLADVTPQRGTCSPGQLRLRPGRSRTWTCSAPTTAADIGELELGIEVEGVSLTTLTGSGSATITVERAPFPDPDFPDVPDDAFWTEAVHWMASTGITTGYPDGTYRPGAPVTRLSAAAFLHRFMGEPAPTDPEAFPDVPADAFYADAIAWMAEQNITTGYPDGTYRPGAPVTRLSIAAFLHRLASTESAWEGGGVTPPPSVLF